MSTLSKELTFENSVMLALCRKGQIRQKWFLSTDSKSNAKLKMTGLLTTLKCFFKKCDGVCVCLNVEVLCASVRMWRSEHNF